MTSQSSPWIFHDFPVAAGSKRQARRLLDKEELRNYEGILDDRFQDNFRVRCALKEKWDDLYGDLYDFNGMILMGSMLKYGPSFFCETH